MANHKFDIRKTLNAASNGKDYVEAHAGLFSVGDVLIDERRSTAPPPGRDHFSEQCRYKFEITGIGPVFELDDVEMQRFYGRLRVIDSPVIDS